MANHAANDIGYYLLIEEKHRADLAGLRKWGNLKTAFEENFIWVKDFDYAQVFSLQVKSIPYKKLFYSRNGKLFPLNSLLPDRNIPALLWTPIDRALPVKLPLFNHNYFGIHEKIAVNLVPGETEAAASAMITGIDVLESYIQTAAAIRLQKLKWTILNNDKVLLVGTPLLPLKGNVYWQRRDFLLPAGYDLELPLLTEAFNNTINPWHDALVIWNSDSTYFTVEKSDLRPLSLSSFRFSMQKLSAGTF
jgi:hypothetical protein